MLNISMWFSVDIISLGREFRFFLCSPLDFHFFFFVNAFLIFDIPLFVSPETSFFFFLRRPLWLSLNPFWETPERYSLVELKGKGGVERRLCKDTLWKRDLLVRLFKHHKRS